MSKPLTPLQEKRVNAILNITLLGGLLEDRLESLEGTAVYKHKFKQLAKQLLAEIDKDHFGKQMSLMFNVDETLWINLSRNYDELFQNLQTLEPYDVLIYNQLLTKYKSDPKKYCELNEVELIPLNQNKDETIIK